MDNFAAEDSRSTIDADRNFVGKIAVEAYNGNIKGNSTGEIAIKLHVAVEANARHDTVTDAGILPQGIAKFTYFVVLDALDTVAPKQTVFVGNTPVLFVDYQ